MEETSKPKSKKALPIILALVIIGAAAFGVNKYIYSVHHEDTDDAQIDADISPVLTRVTGYVSEIRFEDNKHVNIGDTLVKLDDRDLAIKVQQAEAALENAQANVSVAKANTSTAQANYATAKSNVEGAKVRVWKATEDYNRFQSLVSDKAITQQQFDATKAEKLSAESQLESANKQQAAAEMQVHSADEQITVAQSQIRSRQADLDYAKLQLSYVVITAPASGLASKKNILLGQLVNAGSPLFAIVSDSGVYVTANFKETQLTKMKEGQKVEVVVDAFKSNPIEGSLYNFSAATGAKFSLLPPDNETGNYVKVVQRVPVKIKLNGDKEIMARLRAGMSVRVSVNLD